MTTRKVPPPPPDAALSPFEVGAYLAGHVPEYVVHSIQTGGTTQAERIERHRRYLTPEGFAAWLETEDAKRTDVDPLRVIECSAFGGAMSIEQHEETFAQIGKPPGIQAANLEVVKAARKAKAEREKKSTGGKKGKAQQIENAKRKASERTRARTSGDLSRLDRLRLFRAKHPECSLPDARDHLVRFLKLAFQSTKAAEDWLRDRVKRGEVQPFPPAPRGRPPGAGKARRSR